LEKDPDWRVQEPMPEYLTDFVRKPQYALGPMSRRWGWPLRAGAIFLGTRFASGAFIARHGSWNRHPLSGYDVVFVAFDDHGNVLPAPPAGLTGFLKGEDKTHGRPVWVSFAKDGALLVSDDVGEQSGAWSRRGATGQRSCRSLAKRRRRQDA
jgi:glucose/arabinose dehydrogenase